MNDRYDVSYKKEEVPEELFSKTFIWMFIGLCISGICAWSVSLLGGISWTVFLVSTIVELILVFCLSGPNLEKMSSALAGFMYAIFSAVNGVTLSSIFLIYELKSVLFVFFIAAGLFGIMALFGYFTKVDLSKIGTFLCFALFGVLIVLIINLFLKNTLLDTILSIVVVLLMMVTTAYDIYTMKHKNFYFNKNGHIFFALSLYLDFINILLYLLRLFGKKK